MKRALLCGWMLTVFAAGARADPIAVAPSSKVWIEGDSSLHKWRADAKRFTLTLDVAPGETGSPEQLLRAGKVRGGTLVVPVAQLSSGEDGLDKNLRKALRADANPEIRFVATRVEVVPAAGDALELRLRGSVTVAGVAQDVDIVAQAKRAPDGLHVTGTQMVRMTAFKVDPPVLMLGAIKTADAVAVRFELVLVGP